MCRANEKEMLDSYLNRWLAITIASNTQRVGN